VGKLVQCQCTRWFVDRTGLARHQTKNPNHQKGPLDGFGVLT
jgi:hypothetical protein